VELAELPLTGSGKVDRKGLPDPELPGIGSKAYAAPRTRMEELLAEIWQELLGVEQVGIYDDFFELGGHSLLAMRLVSMVRSRLQVELAIKEVFDLGTIEKIVLFIDYNHGHNEIQKEYKIIATI
jgi:acyl carrier protein